MNLSIYAAALMMVGKGKYVNKETQFAVTRQRLGQRSLLLLGSPVVIDFLCCSEAELPSQPRE